MCNKFLNKISFMIGKILYHMPHRCKKSQSKIIWYKIPIFYKNRSRRHLLVNQLKKEIKLAWFSIMLKPIKIWIIKFKTQKRRKVQLKVQWLAWEFVRIHIRKMIIIFCKMCQVYQMLWMTLRKGLIISIKSLLLVMKKLERLTT